MGHRRCGPAALVPEATGGISLGFYVYLAKDKTWGDGFLQLFAHMDINRNVAAALAAYNNRLVFRLVEHDNVRPDFDFPVEPHADDLTIAIRTPHRFTCVNRIDSRAVF